MGTFLITCIVTLCIMWMGGFSYKLLGWMMFTLLISFFVLVLSSAYRFQHFMNILDPWTNSDWCARFHYANSPISFARDNWFGVGLSERALRYSSWTKDLPDFRLGVITEHLGLIGLFSIILLFAVFVTRAFSIGHQAAILNRPFAALLAKGIAAWMAIQAMINFGQNEYVIAVSGVTFPFLSFSGTEAVVDCIAAAIAIRIDWENRQIKRGLAALPDTSPITLRILAFDYFEIGDYAKVEDLLRRLLAQNSVLQKIGTAP